VLLALIASAFPVEDEEWERVQQGGNVRPLDRCFSFVFSIFGSGRVLFCFLASRTSGYFIFLPEII
jgi:hypothetical protein